MSHDIFISYSRKDLSEVEMLCKALTEANLSYWIDRNDIPLAASFPALITDAIEASRMVIFVSSANSKESDYVTHEIFFALNHKVIVVPFKLDEENYNDNLKLYLDIYNHYPAYPPPISVYLREFINKISSILNIHSVNKPVFKRIIDENDPDLLVLLTIYRSCFTSDKNVSEEFIIRNLSAFTQRHQAYLFVLKTINKIIGIADVSYFPKQKRLFISYIGVYHYKSPGDQLIYTHNIIEGLITYFSENKLTILDIIFETEEDRVFRYFSRILKNRFQITPYKLCFDYVQPKMLADNEAGVTEELPVILIYIPFRKVSSHKTMTKSHVLEIINFLHSNIYQDITNMTLEEHSVYLNQLYKRYEESLPESIPLLSY